MFEREADLDEPEHDLLLGKRFVSGDHPLLDPPVEVALFRELHDDVQDPGFEEALVVAHDVRVVQLGQNLNLRESEA